MAKLQTLRPRLAEIPLRTRPHTVAHHVRIRGRALQAIRDRILTRDRGLCRCARCTRFGELKPASDVDHAIPLWAGGPEDDANRLAIAQDCHLDKTRAEAGMRARGIAPTDPAAWLDYL